MAVIHVPPKACSRCAQSEVLAIVPPTETVRNEPRERGPRWAVELPFPFLRSLERTDRSGAVSLPRGSGLRRLEILRSGT